MPQPPMREAMLRETYDALRLYKSVALAARHLKINRSTFANRWAKAKIWAEDNKLPLPELRNINVRSEEAIATDGIRVSGDHAEIVKTTNQQVRTLADLIRICDIDTNEWEIERWIANKWEMGAKLGLPGDEEIKVTPLFQVKAWLVAKNQRTKTLERLRELLVTDIRADLKRTPPKLLKRKYVSGGWLYEFAPVDMHFGKFAWGEETVTNYDVNEADDLFKAALQFQLERALKLTDGKLEHILCLFGNDVAHIDSKENMTTKGTRMDVDTRYIKVYRRICEIHRWAIDLLSQHAPVTVKIVPGNHDELTSFHLGEILATRYDGSKYVTVDNSPRLRKYFNFGTNLFGFTHGDSEKITDLPLIMAREVPDLWARCESREWHIGHKHIAEKHTWKEQDLFSDKGVRVRRLSSLSAHDAWHVKNGYIDRRACEGFIFHKTAGFTDLLSFNVEHFLGTPTWKKTK